jgi:undecaprenyl-diphosphatase
VLFDIVIQLGAILAVIVFFWNKIWPFSSDRNKNKETWNLWAKAIVGVLPAIVLGAIFGNFIENRLFNPWVVAVALIIGGLIILIVERKNRPGKITSISNLSFKTAFFIGLIQCLSMIPGTSRSAATIIGAMLLGASRVVATEFSFFLAIPTMIAASAYILFKYRGVLSGNQIVLLVIGFVTSFVVALVAIKFLINYIKNHNFKVFGWYRIILGALIIIYFLAR